MSKTPLYTVTITLADQEDGSVAVSMYFDPSVSKDAKTTPALRTALDIIEWTAERAEEAE